MLFPKTVKKIKQTFQKEKDPKDIEKAKDLFQTWEKNRDNIENISNIYEHRKKAKLSLKDFTENLVSQRELKVAFQTYAIKTNKGGVSKNTRKRLQKKIGIAA